MPMMAPSDSSTIFALSSGRGRAGVAVIRISGGCVRDTLEMLTGGVPEPRQAVLRRLSDPHSQELLDEALVLFFAAPASFTGEDIAEAIHFVATMPAHVNINILEMMPVVQAFGPFVFDREEG